MALTLTRKGGQSVHVGEETTVTVNRLNSDRSGGRVQLLIDAPIGSVQEARPGIIELRSATAEGVERVMATIRTGDELTIEQGTIVFLNEVDGNQARLGFIAPKTVQIFRSEIWDRIKTQSAATSESGEGQG